jgi:hypothetical protein
VKEKRPDGDPSGLFVAAGSALAGHDLERAVIVAMAAVWMVQVAIDQVVDMVAVRHGFMAAARTVLVTSLMAAAIVIRRAGVGIAAAHFDHMFVEMVFVRVMQVAIVEIVHVIAVPDRGVAAARTVLVRVFVMDLVLAVGHGLLLSSLANSILFAGMRDSILDQRQDVIVGDAVDDALAFSPASNQPGGMQDLQPGRNGRHLLAFGSGDFRNAETFLRQQHQRPEPRRVRQRVEHGCRSLQLPLAGRCRHAVTPSFHEYMD